MLIDTDILIDFLRGIPASASFLEEAPGRSSLSAITVAELYQGVRDGSERVKLAETLSVFDILSVTREIGELAGLYRRDFRPRFGCGLADCLIAATAYHHKLPLATRNVKHLGMLDRVVMPYTL